MHQPEQHTPTVLVGYDGGQRSLRAVRWAAAFAGANSAQLNVVTAWSSVSGAYRNFAMAIDPDAVRKAAQDDVSSTASQLGYPDVRAVVVEGPARTTLVAGASPDRVIVLGTRGHLGAWGALTSGVARYCVTRAGCPVVLLGPRAASAPVERVLVVSALDPTGSTLGWAARVAAATSSQVVDLGSLTLAPHVVAEAQDVGWPQVLTGRTFPADLLVLPSSAARAPRYGEIRCPVALLPERGDGS